jgi:hypothetical protein
LIVQSGYEALALHVGGRGFFLPKQRFNDEFEIKQQGNQHEIDKVVHSKDAKPQRA